MKNFRVGDHVRAISENYAYTTKSNKWEGIVTEVYDDRFSAKTIRYSGDNYVEHEFSCLHPEHFELVDKTSIHVYRQGNSVKAIVRNGAVTVKSAEAKCSPEDAFDFHFGAKLALNRLFGTGIIPEKKKLVILRHGQLNGVVGDPAGLRDIRGTDLCVGDIVEVYRASGTRVSGGGKRFIVQPNKDVLEFQPAGCGFDWINSGKNGFDTDGWYIIKLHDHSTLREGDEVNGYKIVME